jgi:eukaryotic-like serine/threonine-protein kinase
MVALEPGTTLAHYRILERLGQGGQATAYKAEDLRLSRPVVIKILRPELASSEGARKRFEREACLLSLVDNPNISAVFDVGEAEGLCYIVMQFVEGRTLKELVGGRPLDPLGALSIAIQVADALAVAHASGVVHRDIKPSNVIVTAVGQAKVLDFGLAKMMPHADLTHMPSTPEDPLTEVGVPMGSLGYGSPEQAAGERVDHRTDVFSLGVILYEMITGQGPFRGRHRLEQLNAVLNVSPRPIRALNPLAPPALQAILDRALAKDPKDRFQTMAAFRDELKSLMRRLSQETGVIPTEASATLLAPQRMRNAWALGGGFGRVFGRLRPARSQPLRAADAPPSPTGLGPRPASWGSETKKTLAVLPFRNLMGDPGVAFYEFALADALITELAQLSSLIVRPSSYIAPYAGQNVDPRQVGQELAVHSVLVGSFVKAEGRLRVNAQVVSTSTGEIVWSDKIDVTASDLITVQDQIAERVVAGLRLTLTSEEQQRMGRLPTRSPEAYEFYLRGRDLLFRYILHTLDLTDLERAIAMFNEAAGLDPGFAGAHAALARCYVLHAQGYGGTEYYLLAERSLKRALELDPGEREARLQGVYVDLYQGDKARAEETIAALREQAPHDPTVLLVAGMLCRLDGLHDEALAHYDQLAALNPQDAALAGYYRGRVHTHRGEYARAVTELQAARAAEPEHPLIKIFLGIAYFHQGRLDEAQGLVEEVLRTSPHFEGVYPLLAWCLAERGEHGRARQLITPRVREYAQADFDISYWLACFYAREGTPEEALQWLHRSVRLGNEDVPLFSRSRHLDPLRDDPRFRELMAAVQERYEERLAQRHPAVEPGA